MDCSQAEKGVYNLVTDIIKYFLVKIVVLSTFICCFILIFKSETMAKDYDIKGQLTVSSDFNSKNEYWFNNLNLRYIPEASWSQTFLDIHSIDINGSLNLNYNYNHDLESDFAYDLYRLKLRYLTEQADVRLGLQKINFGPAQILRALKWFDQMDPLDPIKLTDGIYALRLRYYFLNNANIWLWSMYGNNNLKGYEILKTKKDSLEFGGRFQYPVYTGEIAFSYHLRQFNNPLDNKQYPYENRFALDGRWDIEIGLWFETVVSHYNVSNALLTQYSKTIMLGADYTFSLGNGLYIMLEHLRTEFSNDFLKSDLSSQITALNLSYSLGLFDKLSLMELYNFETENIYSYIRWDRIYDLFTISFSLFWFNETKNTDTDNKNRDNTNMLGLGKGGQIMFVYYH